MTKTIDQIKVEGHKVVADNEETFKTQSGMFIYVWKKLSKFKLQMVEQYRVGLAL